MDTGQAFFHRRPRNLHVGYDEEIPRVFAQKRDLYDMQGEKRRHVLRELG